MKILAAKHSGFCFGVSRAIDLVNRAAESDARVCTYGKIIHNEGVVKELEARGIHAIEMLDELHAGDTLVIRAHGAPPEVFRACEEKGVRLHALSSYYHLPIPEEDRRCLVINYAGINLEALEQVLAAWVEA